MSQALGRLRARPRLFLVVVTVLVGLPFLNQAFHIDDRIYLEIADQIARTPLFPYDYENIFEGIVTPNSAAHSHLPLTSYWIAIVEWATGSRAEWVMHLAFLVFPCLAAVSFYDLSRRLFKHPLSLSLLFLISPAFFVLSHTLMTEVALVAFWLLSLSRFFALCQGSATRADRALLGLGLLGAAGLSLLSVGLVLLLLVHWLFLRRFAVNRLSGRSLALYLSLPILLWVLWLLRAYLHYGYLPLVNTWLHMDKRGAFDWGLTALKLGSFLLNLGATLLFPLAIWIGWGRRWSWRTLPLLGYAGLVPFALWIEGWNWPQAILWAALMVTGLLAFWGILRMAVPAAAKLLSPRRPSPLEDADDAILLTTLGLWFLGIFATALALYYAGSVRYALLAFPPGLLLWACSIEQVYPTDWQPKVVWTAILLTLPYSTLLAVTDYQFAGMYRQAASDIVRLYGGPDRQVWFTAEWGLRYYLEREGARVLPRAAVGPKAGDVVVKCYVAFPWVTVYDGEGYLRYRASHPLTIASPVRMLDFSSHAGFYSTGWGILPFAIRAEEDWERLNVFEVLKAYDKPLPEQERHY